MKKNKLVLFSLFAFLSFPALAQQAVSLKKGQKYESSMVTKVVNSASAMGQELVSTFNYNSTTAYEVTDTKKEAFDLTSTTKKMFVSMESMGQSNSYDSDKSDNSGPLADAMKDKVNVPKKFSIDTKGNVISKEAVKEEDSPIPGVDQSEPGTELFIPVLFSKPLTVGGSFQDSSTVKKEKHESTTNGTYSVTAVENGIASINYVAKQTVVETLEQMGMEMINKSTNNITAEIKVDTKTGIMLSKISTIDSQGTIETMGMEIPSTTKTTITQTTKEVK